MSALIAEAPNPRAVIVAIHGGGTSAVYFDCPGHPSLSLLRAGVAHGFTVLALDRPGYGSSAPYPEAMARPEQRVQLAYAAVDRILGHTASTYHLKVLSFVEECIVVRENSVVKRATTQNT